MTLSSRVKNLSVSLTLAITAKAKKMKEEGVDVIGFGSGEPDFDTPPSIKDAAIEAIRQGFTKYTPVSGTDLLKQSICKKLSRENNLEYKPSQVVVSCGAKHSLYNIIQVICDEGDEIVMPSPYWLSYPEMVRLAGGRPLFIETGEKNHFKIDADSFKKSISADTRALILNSPSNPAGCVYSIGELKALARIAVEKDILVISDEIYEKIVFNGKSHVSIASIGGDIFRNTIVVNGVSKSFAMTGWRIGYAASCREDIMDAMERLQGHSTSNPPSISQAAAVKAIRGRDYLLREMVSEFGRRRDYIAERLNRINGLSCIKPEGAFYVFCRIDRNGLSSVALAERLLEEAQVAVVPGKAFGSDRHIRLSFATSMENIKNGMDRIEQWFEG